MSVSIPRAVLAAVVGLCLAVTPGFRVRTDAAGGGNRGEFQARNADAAASVQLPAEVPSDATRYSVLMMGNPAGVLAEWSTADARRHVFFAFNDRGRGPRILEVVALRADGTPSSVELEGNDYLKTPVTEHFSLAEGTARWKNQAEEGTTRPAGRAFYLSINGAPAELAWLANALLENGGRMPLLPDGAATIRKLRAIDVEAGARKQVVDGYGITGLDLSPTVVWLDRDRHFFASGNSWFTVIREGWETSAAAILAADEDIGRERARDLASRLPHRSTSDLVFDDVSVFDAQTARLVPHQRVVVSGTTIKSVGPAGGPLAEGAERIDGRGRTLLPGLWDMHVHLDANQALLDLANGVTSVRDLGNDNDELAARRERIDRGLEVGPRIIAAGFIDGPGPYHGPTKVLASTEQEARDYVRMYAAKGFPQIKIYSSLPPALVPAIIDEAHKRGMRVSGHIPAGMTASECVRDGLDEIQHINFVFLNFMPDVKNTQTPARFTEPGRRAAGIDLQSDDVRQFVRLLKERGTVVDVTLEAFEAMYTGTPGKLLQGWADTAPRLPAQVRRALLAGSLPVPPGMEQTYRDAYSAFLKMTKLLFDAGVPLETGTDDVLGGFALDRELELHVQAGIPAAKALQNATWDAARIMKRDAQLGSIAPGKLADLVLIDGDPTTDISRVRDVSLVVKDGAVYRPDEILGELGIAPRATTGTRGMAAR